jgi:hypothetical protein
MRAESAVAPVGKYDGDLAAKGTGTHRTSGRQAQTLQAYRTPMQEDAQNYGSFVALALGFILIKSVHTA